MSLKKRWSDFDASIHPPNCKRSEESAALEGMFVGSDVAAAVMVVAAATVGAAAAVVAAALVYSLVSPSQRKFLNRGKSSGKQISRSLRRAWS